MNDREKKRLRLEHLENNATAGLQKYMPDILRIADEPLPPNATLDQQITKMCMNHVGARMLVRLGDAKRMEQDYDDKS